MCYNETSEGWQAYLCTVTFVKYISVNLYRRTSLRLYEILKMSFNRQWTTAKLKKKLSQSYVSFIVNNETFLFVYSVFLPKTPRSFIYWHGQSWNTYSCFKERDLQKLEKSVYPNYKEIVYLIPIPKVNLDKKIQKKNNHNYRHNEDLHRMIDIIIAKLKSNRKERTSKTCHE